jgi:sulfite reductase subunit B
MKILSKEDFSAFVNALIEDESMNVEGVISKGEKFVFGTLDSADDLRLDYDVTILPPKKYFLPQYETMMTFDLAEGKVAKPAVTKKTVIIGIHPYDLGAIQQMDKYFLDTNVDDSYLQKRKNTILIGLMPVNVSEKAFYGNFVQAMGGPPEAAFDLMLTVNGDNIAVIAGSDAGGSLLDKANIRDATLEEVEKVQSMQHEIFKKATRDLKVNPKGWYDLLAKNYYNEVWAKQAEKCLACGTCTLVCPTCFCYDVTDEVNLDVTTGERKRTWDGCLLRDFTKVGTGEIFREKTEDRYRHRFNRKGRYLPDNLGFLACVGCGRCATQCVPDIADPVELFNMLAETTTEPIEESTRPLSAGPVDIAGAPDGDFLYIPREATLKRVEQLTERETLFEIALDDGKPLGHQPGQFVEVSIMGTGEAPISVSSAPGGDTFEIVVRKVGDVTSKLHSMQPGDKVGIRGPFGTGFDVEALKGKNLLFIGGGLGVVPMRSLYNHVLNNRGDFGDVTILYGCKEPCELLFSEEIATWKDRSDFRHLLTVDSCTEDESWEGDIGVVGTLIPKVEFDPKDTTAIVVGPPIFYRFVIADLTKTGMPEENIIVSLERRMKCGVGKCGHCQINGVYVCKEGPVFNYMEIKNQPEAFE